MLKGYVLRAGGEKLRDKIKWHEIREKQPKKREIEREGHWKMNYMCLQIIT